MTPVNGPFAADRAIDLPNNTNALITTQDCPSTAGVPFDDLRSLNADAAAYKE